MLRSWNLPHRAETVELHTLILHKRLDQAIVAQPRHGSRHDLPTSPLLHQRLAGPHDLVARASDNHQLVVLRFVWWLVGSAALLDVLHVLAKRPVHRGVRSSVLQPEAQGHIRVSGSNA